MYILSEYEQMKAMRDRFGELYTLLEREINGMLEKVSKLRLPWEGAASKAYIIRIKADTIMLSLILKRLKSAECMLESAILEYQKNENEIARLIEGIGGMNG